MFFAPWWQNLILVFNGYTRFGHDSPRLALPTLKYFFPPCGFWLRLLALRGEDD